MAVRKYTYINNYCLSEYAEPKHNASRNSCDIFAQDILQTSATM